MEISNNERRESNREWAPLPLGLSSEHVSLGNRANEQEWDEYQGGIPTVVQAKVSSSGLYLYYVFHDYPNINDPTAEGAIVKTDLSFLKNMGRPSDFKDFIDANGKITTKEFPTALSWRCHGQACERKYRIEYPRVKPTLEKLEEWLKNEPISSYRIFPGTKIEKPKVK